VGICLRLIPLVFGRLTSSRVKVTWGYARTVSRLVRNMGERGAAAYLKVAYLLVQQRAGGQKAKSPWALGANVSRTRRGIPRLINPQHRALILQGDVATIRFWLSLLGLYRVLDFRGSLKLKTIWMPGKDISAFRSDFVNWLPNFFAEARLITGDKWEVAISKDLTPYSIPFIRKSSPNSGGWASVMALPWDMLAFASDPFMMATLKRWLNLVDGVELIWGINKFQKLFMRLATKWWRGLGSKPWTYDPPGKGGPKTSPLWRAYASTPLDWLVRSTRPMKSDLIRLYAQAMWGKPLWFGRLGFKMEPGKIRVFAMVNIITQALMQPLHKWIFARLRMIPTDGTFNQYAPVERLLGKLGAGSFIASYDLSAATDRLPLQLQTDLLTKLLGNELPLLWASLLVGRPYGLPRIARSYNPGMEMVSYAVGQPMGALSSWAMLALTHHALVQFAASKAYPQKPGWFLLYAVLGDDVVIADKLVAREYLKIMREIGVEVGLAKSLVSNTTSLEFAKRTWIKGREVSPVSLAEMLVALRNLGALEELVKKNKRFFEMRVSDVARFAGFGYRNLARLPVVLSVGNRLSGLIAYLSRPGGVWPMTLESWLSSPSPGGPVGSVVDTRQWAVSSRLWKQVIGALLSRLVGFDKTLYRASETKFSEITVKVPRKGDTSTAAHAEGKGPPSNKVLEEVSFFRSSKDLFGLDAPVGAISPAALMMNDFFREWVAYPFSQRLRRMFEKIDDVLRVLDPNIQPEWRVLDEVWTQVTENEEGVDALPSTVDYAQREDVEINTSTRIINLWKSLRRVASARSAQHLNVRAGSVEAPKARRRRKGG